MAHKKITIKAETQRKLSAFCEAHLDVLMKAQDDPKIGYLFGLYMASLALATREIDDEYISVKGVEVAPDIIHHYIAALVKTHKSTVGLH